MEIISQNGAGSEVGEERGVRVAQDMRCILVLACQKWLQRIVKYTPLPCHCIATINKIDIVRMRAKRSTIYVYEQW